MKIIFGRKKQLNEQLTALGTVASFGQQDVKPSEDSSEGGSGYSPANYKEDPEFNEELNRVAKKFDVDAKDLLAVIHSESGVDPKAKNKGSGATGLIQFMPSTAKALGTTTDELFNMTRAKQMTYVEKFFDMMKLPHGASGGMIYATIFLPGRRGRDVLTSQGEGYYNSNKGLDLDKNGDISMKDLDNRVKQMRATFGLNENKKIIIKFGEVLTEDKKKDDRCVRIAKRKYKAWPSAYASGAVVKCRQGKIWKKESEEEMEEGRKLGKPSSETNLGDWFKRKGAPGKKGGWVDCNTCRDGKCKPCGRQEGEKRSKYPRCRPTPSQCKGYKRRGSNIQESHIVNSIAQLLGYGGVALAAGAAEAAFRAHRMKKRTPKFAKLQKQYFHQILIGLMKSEEAMKEYNNKSFIRATEAMINANIVERERGGSIRFYMKDLYARIGKVYKHGDGLKFERQVDKEDLYNLNIPAFEEKYGEFFKVDE